MSARRRGTVGGEREGEREKEWQRPTDREREPQRNTDPAGESERGVGQTLLVLYPPPHAHSLDIRAQTATHATHTSSMTGGGRGRTTTTSSTTPTTTQTTSSTTTPCPTPTTTTATTTTATTTATTPTTPATVPQTVPSTPTTSATTPRWVSAQEQSAIRGRKRQAGLTAYLDVPTRQRASESATGRARLRAASERAREKAM